MIFYSKINFRDGIVIYRDNFSSLDKDTGKSGGNNKKTRRRVKNKKHIKN